MEIFKCDTNNVRCVFYKIIDDDNMDLDYCKNTSDCCHKVVPDMLTRMTSSATDTDVQMITNYKKRK